MSDFWFWILVCIYILGVCIGVAYSWSQLDDRGDWSDCDEGILISVFWPFVLILSPFYFLIILFKKIFDDIFGVKYKNF